MSHIIVDNEKGACQKSVVIFLVIFPFSSFFILSELLINRRNQLVNKKKSDFDRSQNFKFIQ
jgi:hypothetical protein